MNWMRRIEKPWGYELVWAETAHYVGKILHLSAGHQLSRQYHQQKDETFLVQRGTVILEIGPITEVKTIEMKEGASFHCTPRTIHRLKAITDADIVEVSTPELEDVVRLEDAYGREDPSS